MTVDDLIAWLQAEKAKGLGGDVKVIWDAISHSYDVEPKVTTRQGIHVVLMNN